MNQGNEACSHKKSVEIRPPLVLLLSPITLCGAMETLKPIQDSVQHDVDHSTLSPNMVTVM